MISRLTFYLILCSINFVFSQTSPYQFVHYAIDDGLPSNAVTDIIEDQEGFIWIATQSGLCRFDGYQFKTFQHHPNDSNSITTSQVGHLLLANDGNIWVGPWGNTFNLYDQKSERFIPYNLRSASTCFLEDDLGDLWIGSYANLWKLHKGAEVCDSIPEAGQISVASLCKDRVGNIWIGSWDRILTYHPGRQQFKTYTTDFGTESILEDTHGNLWVGSFNGLGLFDPISGGVTWYQQDPNNSSGPGSNKVNCIYEDRNKKLWVGTNRGLHLFDKLSGLFKRISIDNSNPDKQITSICEDKAGNIWIGTGSNGVYMLKAHRYPFHHFQNQPGNQKSISHNDVTTFFEREDSNILIGTRGGGLNLFNRSNWSFSTIPLPNQSQTVEWAILQDHDGYLWVNSEGLKRFHPNLRTHVNDFITYPIFPWTIFLDSRKEVWTSSLFTLGRFQPEISHPNQYTQRKKLPSGLIEGHSNSIYEDSKQNIWVCTPHGLYLYDPVKDHFEGHLQQEALSVMDEQDGIFLVAVPGGLIEYDWKADSILNHFDFGAIVPIGAEIDDSGNYWVISPNGLYQFNYKNHIVKKYDHTDGMPINQFNTWASMKSHSGELFFGGDNGFIYFHPDSLKANTYLPTVVITDFLLANQTVPISGSNSDTSSVKSPLFCTINQTEQIILPFRQNIFSFQFAALDYTNPSKNRYRYQLLGFTEDWIETDANNRVATFTNLDPGDYTFTVIASNNDGLWNPNGKSIQITILPPWWLTWWAYAAYFLILIGIFILIMRDIRRRDKMKLRLQLEQLEVRKMKELDEMKTQFFANISHEFRTPLTLILGPLKQMYDGLFSGDPNNIYEMMIRNGNRLLKLINQLLDFSKLEAGIIPLQASEVDLIAFSKMIFANFESTAQSRNIRYFFQSDTSKLKLYLDKKHFEKIILNLLSNAFKFTPDKGEIFLKISKNISNETIDKGDGIVEIEVADTGIGIEKDQISHIFDRFYQVEDAKSSMQEGTGIGLALVKELVKLHYGSIDVISKKSLGTSFIIHLPLGKSHLTTEELAIGAIEEDSLRIPASLPHFRKDNFEEQLDDSKLALIVEDNPDMRKFIAECLLGDYKIIESVNGEDGLDKAVNKIPDVIVSDVMMPMMDGYELCQKLKLDERTSHIPVILLTAKADKKSKIIGLEFGADDYLTKPFNIDELQIRIRNLIKQRAKLRRRFSKNITLQPKELAITSTDEKFINRALKIIQENIDNTEFGAEQFSYEIGLSRSQLHRKLKALANQSALDFIRSYRLNFAKQLLDKQYGNIAEISYASGFNNPSYFAECFRKQFGILPSEALRQQIDSPET